ncbi:MAG TPA: hypothetical protein VFH00_04875 [Candidatus Nitrosotalea sp.]|nr:hypothetical protein [Candidatus Nitrosotalea sp.]
MSNSMLRGRRGQAGQTIVLVALMMVALFAGVGLAVDTGVGYYWNSAAERAAVAGALSGVIFMPNQLTSAQAITPGNDATDRAIAEAKKNGFDTANTGENVQVTVAPVGGFANQLAVTVSRSSRTYFMPIFGFTSFKVSRTAIASYLPAITLGQPGSQLGSTVSQLGNSGYYFMRTEGWTTNRGQGDAFTPKPTGCGAPACDSNDVHGISDVRGTDGADASLPARGAYNIMITIPPGSSGRIQVYNAAFSPDACAGGTTACTTLPWYNGSSNPNPANYCENWKAGTPVLTSPAPGVRCSTASQNYFMHEDDCCNFNYSDNTTYSTMKYTVFKMPNVFIRSSDQFNSRLTVHPLDARNWNQGPSQYRDVTAGVNYTQAYAADGHPTNLMEYHAWTDVAGPGGYTSGLSTYNGSQAVLGPGSYRLRIDTLEFDGSNPPGNSQAHKGLAVRVADSGGNSPCGTCSVSAMSDMAIYTPVNLPSTGSFNVPLFQLPPDYAGKTISVDIYDPGDTNGATTSGTMTLGIADPSGSIANVAPGVANMYNLGTQRSNYPGGATLVASSSSPIVTVRTSGGSVPFDNYWLHFDIPIPASYNPGASPSNWWWSLQYGITGSVAGTDTVTVAVSLRGNPAHLVIS